MSRRAELRREARARAKTRFVPAVPGVLPDRTEKTIEVAMAEAHLVLPTLAGTQVTLTMYAPEEGFEMVRALFGDAGVDRIRAKIEALPPDAPLPTVMLATRQYRDAHLRHRNTTTEEGVSDE